MMKIPKTKTIIKTLLNYTFILLLLIACNKDDTTDIPEEEPDNGPKIVGCNSVEYDGYIYNNIGCAPGIAFFNIQITEGEHSAEFNIQCSDYGCISYVALPDEDTVNYPPSLNFIEDQTVTYIHTKTIYLSAHDMNQDILTYSIEPDLDFLTLGDNELVINPEEKDVGNYNLTVTVSDGKGETDSKDFTINIVRYIWAFNTVGEINSCPAIGSDNTIYVNAEGSLFAINPDGTEKWEFVEDISANASPVIGSDGTIYTCSHYSLYAVNPDGTMKWECETGEMYESTPAIALDGTIYVGSRENKLYAIKANGDIKWEFEADDYIDSSPVIALDNTIYVGSHAPGLYAINPDGTMKWEFETTVPIRSSPAIATDGTIYVGSWDDLYALNPDGTEKWKFNYAGGQSSPAIATDGTIYVGSYSDALFAINPDGTEKWVFEASSNVNSSPAIASDGTIYFGSQDNYIYAIHPDGTKKWEIETGSFVPSSPVIAVDGTIYIGCEISMNNVLCAIYGEDGPANSPWPVFHHDLKHTGRQE
ncbi:MAG: PQQ-binding-like beta-propeller repeat protein [Bacteroidales bacterium]|nr:PQQ-binding-like beta-propeller repeat protein [Bacteroidales bacterium]